MAKEQAAVKPAAAQAERKVGLVMARVAARGPAEQDSVGVQSLLAAHCFDRPADEPQPEPVQQPEGWSFRLVCVLSSFVERGSSFWIPIRRRFQWCRLGHAPPG